MKIEYPFQQCYLVQKISYKGEYEKRECITNYTWPVLDFSCMNSVNRYDELAIQNVDVHFIVILLNS